MSLASTGPVQTFLAFDYGLKRVGVATGNSLMRQAQPLRTISAEGDARFKAIGQLIAEWAPDALVIGVPFHPDGANAPANAHAGAWRCGANGLLPRAGAERRLPARTVQRCYLHDRPAAGGGRLARRQ